METVLVATDGSPAATAAVRRAALVAATEGAELIAVYVVPIDDPRFGDLGSLAQITKCYLTVSDEDRPLLEAEQIAHEACVRCRAVAIGDEDPLAGILDAAADLEPDLVVVGSDGHGGLLGTHRAGLGESIVRKARCDVLVVHAQTCEENH